MSHSRPGTVVILARETDATVDAVVCELARRDVKVFRADTSWFPRRLTLSAWLASDGRWRGSLRADRRVVELEDIPTIWYRDPTAFRFPRALTDVERSYAHREARLGLGGVLAALPVLWVNHPNRAADAMYKPVQFATAAACGLSVPPTLVTNVPEAVRGFAGEHGKGNTICKSFGPGTFSEGDRFKVAFTNRFAAADLTDLRGVASTATQFQRRVDTAYEARVVVVGTRMFTIAIRANDQRMDTPAFTYEWVDTPAEVRTGLRRYLRTLGLACAAVEFAIDSAGRWNFLESRGGGQYRWLEARTGAPITAALADLLTEENAP